MNAYRLRDVRRLANSSNNWRKTTWNQWLIGYLTQEAEKVSRADGTTETAGAKNTTATGESPDPNIDGEALRSVESSSNELSTSNPQPKGDVAGPTSAVRSGETSTRDEEEVRGRASPQSQAVRDRLDRLLEQMDEIEMTVERVAERQNSATNHQRLQHREFTDILDRLVETQERHTDSVIACTRAIERLERRVMWVERNGRQPWTFENELNSPSHRPSRVPPLGQTLIPPSMARRVHRTEGERPSMEPNAPLSGKLSDLSLPTLLSTAELEMWTGRLTLETKNRTVQVSLEGGLLVGVSEDDSPSDAVEALHELLDDRAGRFSFSPGALALKTELAPLTVGTLLLRASHLRDEMNRSDVGT